MKTLLGRRSTLLNTAPSFLVREKPNQADRFAITHSPLEIEPLEEADKPAPAARVTPLRPVTASAVQSGAHGVQVAQAEDVERLLHEGVLTTFRAFNSFAYSASLLFHARDLTYYAVLYHTNAIWRALTAADIDTAEPAFRHFVDQATRLADAEMRRVQLEAQNDQLARLIAESEAQVERKQMDLQRGASQDQAVAARQQDLRKELAQLEARRVAAHAQLNKLRRQMHQLNGAEGDALTRLPAGR